MKSATILDDIAGKSEIKDSESSIPLLPKSGTQVWYSRRSRSILLMPRTSAFMLLMRKTSSRSNAIDFAVPTETRLFLFNAAVQCLIFSPFMTTQALSRCFRCLVLDHSCVVAHTANKLHGEGAPSCACSVLHPTEFVDLCGNDYPNPPVH